jgi:hypothetical protein
MPNFYDVLGFGLLGVLKRERLVLHVLILARFPIR